MAHSWSHTLFRFQECFFDTAGIYRFSDVKRCYATRGEEYFRKYQIIRTKNPTFIQLLLSPSQQGRRSTYKIRTFISYNG